MAEPSFDVAHLGHVEVYTDRFEESLQYHSNGVPETFQNRAPWWAWFGLVSVLAAIAGVTISQFA